MTQQKYLEEESKAQKWRRLTPLGILTSVSTNFVGWGIIVWFICYFVQNNDKKFDLQRDENKQVWESVKEVKDQETKDMVCLTKNLYGCCGSRANVSC